MSIVQEIERGIINLEQAISDKQDVRQEEIELLDALPSRLIACLNLLFVER